LSYEKLGEFEKRIYEMQKLQFLGKGEAECVVIDKDTITHMITEARTEFLDIVLFLPNTFPKLVEWFDKWFGE
jgi:hypothetical protein